MIAVADAMGLEGDALLVVAAGHHPRRGPVLQQAGRAADVVAVVVGLQHRHQFQAALLQPGDHRAGHGRIHHRRLLPVVQHDDVVVVEHRDQLHLLGDPGSDLGGREHR